MKKILISLVLLFNFTYAATGCLLTQDLKLKINYTKFDKILEKKITKNFKDTKYIPKSIDGVNFKELFVKSKFIINTTNTNLSITKIEGIIENIKADKRIKGKPRTGSINLAIKLDNKKQIIPMTYNYNDGFFKSTGMLNIKNEEIILSFNTNIQALLCNIDDIKK